jgi:hypothetical protein
MGTQGLGSPALPPLGFYLPPFLERGLGSPGFYSLGTPGLYQTAASESGSRVGNPDSRICHCWASDGLIRSALSVADGF